MNAIDKGRLKIFLREVEDEYIQAVDKFPYPNPNLAALMEEVGELANALLEKKTALHVWREAIQVAAMAARVGIEKDPQFLTKEN